MSFLAALIVFAVTTVLTWAYQRFIAKKSKLEAEPWQAPPVAAGTPIPVLLGTQRVPIICVCFLSDDRTDIIGGGNFATGKQVIGQNHAVTYQGLLSWGTLYAYRNMVINDAILASRLGPMRINIAHGPNSHVWIDRPAVIADHDTAGIGVLIFAGGKVGFDVYMPDIFQKFDGIGGKFTLYFGTGQTGPDPILEAAKGVGNVPDYRELAYVVFDHFRMGMDPSRPIQLVLTKGVSEPGYDGFVVDRKIDDGPLYALAGYTPWTQTDVTIPAALYALAKDRRWALEFDASEIDLAQFQGIDLQTNGGQYATETTGISAVVTSPIQAKALRDEWLAILNAKLVRHPETNLYQLKLIRNETPDQTAIDNLRALDASHIKSIKLTQRSWAETYNEVVVGFANPALLYEKDVVIARNDASIAATGKKRTLTLTLMSVTDPLLAQRIALRELRASSPVLEKQTIVATREAWDITEGDVFKVTYAPVGYQNRVLRCLATSLGRPWANEVTLETIDDVYAHEEPPVTIVQRDPVPPQPRPIQEPVISFGIDYAATTVTVTLFIEDPDNRVLSIAYALAVGHVDLVPEDGPYVAIPLVEPYQITAERDPVVSTYVHVAVTYLDRNGNAATWSTAIYTEPTNQPVAETGTLDGTTNPIVWDVGFRAVDAKSVVIDGNRGLLILNANPGFQGVLTVTSTGGTGYTLTLPAGSIYGDGSSLDVTLGSKDQFSVYYDGTYYWWNLVTHATTVPEIPLEASLSATASCVITTDDLSASLIASGTALGDLTT